jgi:hypothetical protein
MPTYFSGIVGQANGLQRIKHLSGVTTIPDARLDSLCAQWDLVRRQVCFKGFKQGFLSYLDSMKLRTTEQLVTLLNTAVPDPARKIPQGLPSAQLVGPMVLPHLIDYMWLQVIEPVPPNLIKPYTLMYDPDADGGASGPMISHRKRGFRELGVAFRGDTRSFAEFSSNGFTARFSEPPGHPFHVPAVYGTVAAEGMAFDRQARDFANQTGVCVARNIVGSMKFVGARDDYDQVTRTKGYIYAVKFNTGVDTEQMQLDNVLSRGAARSTLWRAGEKAAWQIPKWRFIASCQFEVDAPYSSASNRTFKYRRTSDWTFHWSGVSHLRDYVMAATARMPLNQWIDFGVSDDWAQE